ncbi:unnamed protein product [Rhizophagus irregularis]|nr:unnamed protein product [Rhizophagus irregularis]CAB4419747.1 unnamed protein product [Rhizophagus irregularis]
MTLLHSNNIVEKYYLLLSRKKIYKRLKRIDGDGLVIYGSKCRHLKIILIHNAGRRTVVAFKKIYESVLISLNFLRH